MYFLAPLKQRFYLSIHFNSIKIRIFGLRVIYVICHVYYKRLRLVNFTKRMFTCSSKHVNEPFNRLNVPALVVMNCNMYLTLELDYHAVP